MTTWLNQVAASWWGWTSLLAVQVAVLGIIVWLVDLPLKRRGWPQVRYALWALVFVKLVLPPTFALPTSVAGRVLAPVPAVANGDAAVVERGAPSAPSVGYSVPPGRADAASAPSVAPAVAAPIARPSFQTWLMLVWAAAVIGICASLAGKMRRLREAAHGASADWADEALRAAADRMGLKRVPRVVAASDMESAAVFGLFRPTVFVPESWKGEYSNKELVHILLHELAHIRRLDLAVNAAQTILHVLFWFHPLVWLAGRRTRELRELCCDATVARILQRETVEYRQTLVEAGRRILAMQSPFSLGLLGLFESPARLRTRLEHLARPLWEYRRLRVATTLAVVAAMMLFVMPMNRLKAEPAQTTEAASSVATTPPSTPEAADQGAPESIDVSGTLASESGGPAGGVEVTGYGYTWENGVTTYDAPVTTVTGAEGVFVFQLPRPREGAYWTFVAKTTGSIAFGEATIQPGKPIAPVKMRLGRSDGKVVGKAVDEAGNPVAAAKVVVEGILKVSGTRKETIYDKLTVNPIRTTDEYESHNLSNPTICKWYTVYTGPDGSFEITGLPRGYWADVWLDHEGFPTTRPEIYSPDMHFYATDGVSKTITMPHAGRIEGRVVSADAAINLGGIRIQPNSKAVMEVYSRGTTSDDGSFAIEALAPGDYELKPIAYGKTVWTWLKGTDATVEAGTTARVTVEVIAAGYITGRIVDSETKAGIPYMEAFANSQTVHRNANTEKDGSYTLVMPPGTYEVSVLSRNPGTTYGEQGKDLGKATVVAGQTIAMPDTQFVRQVPKTPDDAAKLEADLQKFYDAYRLKDGENFRIMAAPFMPERLVFYRRSDPRQAEAIPRGPDTMSFRMTGGKIQGPGMGFGDIWLVDTLAHILNLKREDIGGEDEILASHIQGDFIWRDGVTKEALVKEMSGVLTRYFKRPVTCEFRDAEQRVYVARGAYKYSPLQENVQEKPDAVEIYVGTKRDTARPISDWPRGSFDHFLAQLSDYIGYVVQSEATGVPSDMKYVNDPRGKNGDWRGRRVLDDNDAALVLKHVSEQTGLTFTPETRKVRVLFVEYAK